MTRARFTVLLGLAAAAAAWPARAEDVNAWPLFVLREGPSGQVQSRAAIGPLFYSGPAPGPEAGHVAGLRPLYVERTDADVAAVDVLYPLFFYRRYADSYSWSVFQLINHQGIYADVTSAGGPTDRRLDIWPFYFSHETDDPLNTYRALLPIYGTLRGQLGFERLSWTLFPLYVDTQKKGTHTTYAPFPFVRVATGAEEGFALWPLFGATRGPGAARHAFYLWPLVWDNTVPAPADAPEGTAPGTQVGFLPFYTRERSPASVSENYLWPFFGYTERTSPDRYSERRYFWPFLVQGRGAEAVVERWGPFFTHSNVKGTDSTWVGWPLWHRTQWVYGDLRQTRTQFFYFLYWSAEQASVSRPAAATATKRHLWPVVSVWDNGAGGRQVQVPSPIEVFFPDNPDMRDTWAPLVSVYRYDRRPTGETRHSLLWDAVTWRRDAAAGLAEFHLGPVFGMLRTPAGARWSILGFDFGAKLDEKRQPSR